MRRPIYVGCEGASEAGYAALIGDIARQRSLPVHLIIEVLGPGAGDPLARIEMAVRRLREHARKRTAPAASFALLDEDQVALAPQRAQQARNLAADHGIAIIWQRPCFEALLLRHLPGCATRRPQNTPGAGQALESAWGDYRKPMTRDALSRCIDLDGILRAAGVEPELAAMLAKVGLMD